MMQTTLKVKNGVIRLPKELQKAWKQAEVMLFPSDDTIVVKKLQKLPSKLSEIATRLTLPRSKSGDIEKEIKMHRNGK